MLAYKITAPGLVATKGDKSNYQLKMGLNQTPVANCARNGFHCAENPLDCLNYYSSVDKNEIYLVDAGGDIDEDDYDSKISCTELTIIRQITVLEFVAAAVLYVKAYPERKVHSRIRDSLASANEGFCIAKGKNPRCKGNKIGDVLGFIKVNKDLVDVKVLQIDGERYKPHVLYNIKGEECKK